MNRQTVEKKMAEFAWKDKKRYHCNEIQIRSGFFKYPVEEFPPPAYRVQNHLLTPFLIIGTS